MNIYREPFPNIDAGVIALGTFDGVHIGHRAVIAAAARTARALGTHSAVFCFSDLPRNFLARQNGATSPVELLTPPDEKARLIAALGIDELIIPDPTPELLALSPKEFLDTLIGSLHPHTIVAGYNYTYGKDAAGNIYTLGDHIAPTSIILDVIPPVKSDGIPVSATLIRGLLASGDTAAASRLLGRNV